MAEYFPIDVSSIGSYSGSFSGSFFGNGSGLTGITASYLSGSVTSASYAATASYLLGSISSASYALTASYVNPLVQNVIITGSIYIPDSTNSIYFSGSGAASRLVWNDTDGTLDLGLKGGNVTLQIGQEEVIRVVNKTGANLLESQYYAVRVRSVSEGGAQGQRLAVVLAQANNDANSATTIGLVTENIDVNQEGFITTFGLVRNIDTTGALQGETWVDGDMLYLSPTISGSITNIKPQAPQHTVIIGYVVYAHANNGKIFVKVDNGYELDELHNVRITTASLSSGDLLVYSSSVWVNTKQLTGSYNLTGSISVISGSIIGTASNALTASYVNPLVQNVIITGSITTGVANSVNGTVTINRSGGNVGLIIRGSDGNIVGAGNAPVYEPYNYADASHNFNIGHGSAGNYNWFVGTNATLNLNTQLMRLTRGGNLLIGTTTDSGRLTVRGSGTTSATTALRVENANASASLVVLDNGNVGIGITNPAYALQVSRSIWIQPTNNSDDGLYISNQGFLVFRDTANAITTRLRGIAGSYQFQDASYNIKSLISTNNNITYFNNGGGNVGIGTTSPSFTLDVSGSGRFTNGLTVTGSLTTIGSITASAFNFVSSSLTQSRVLLDNTFNNTALSAPSPNSIRDRSPLLRVYGTYITASSLTNYTNQIISAHLYPTFNPTNNTAAVFNTLVLEPQFLNVNATGSARGLYVTPGFTGTHPNWRSIEWDNTEGYGLYGSGTAWNYLNGSLGIGTLTPSASFHTTGSGIIVGSLALGTSSLGSTENTLVVGPSPAGGTGEGGQILLQASGGLYTTASMIDNYQNKFRVLRGTNAGSDAFKLQLDMHTGQMQLPNYNSATAFTGSEVAMLGVDNNGNILTTTVPGAVLTNNYIGAGFTNPIVTYMPFGATTVSGTEAQRQVASPVAGVIKNFYLRTNNTAPATSYTTWTVRINGVSTGITLVVSGGQAAAKYSNTTNSASIAIGDEISLQVSTSVANSPQVN